MSSSEENSSFLDTFESAEGSIQSEKSESSSHSSTSSSTSVPQSKTLNQKIDPISIEKPVEDVWDFSPRPIEALELQSLGMDHRKEKQDASRYFEIGSCRLRKRNLAFVALVVLILIALALVAIVNSVPLLIAIVVLIVIGLSYYTYRRLYFDLLSENLQLKSDNVCLTRRSCARQMQRIWVPGMLIVVVLWTCLLLAFFLGSAEFMLSENKSVAVLFFWFITIAYGYTLVGLACTDLIHLIGWATYKFVLKRSSERYNARRVQIARVKAVVGVLTGVIIAAYAFGHAATDPEILHVTVPMQKLPASFDDFKICLLCDLHASTTISREQIATAVQLCNEQQPDLVALVGDLMDGSVEKLAASLEPLQSLQSAYGTFWVNGNHLFISGNPAQWTEHITSNLNITALRNEHVNITNTAGDTFALAGVDDWTAASRGGDEGFGADPAAALASIPDTTEVVFLAHQPKHVDAAIEYDVGLMLSGHVHKGQVWPQHYIVALDQPYFYGLYENVRNTRTTVFVGAGAGYWGVPARFGSSNEIAIIHLKAI